MESWLFSQATPASYRIDAEIARTLVNGGVINSRPVDCETVVLGYPNFDYTSRYEPAEPVGPTALWYVGWTFQLPGQAFAGSGFQFAGLRARIQESADNGQFATVSEHIVLLHTPLGFFATRNGMKRIDSRYARLQISNETGGAIGPFDWVFWSKTH